MPTTTVRKTDTVYEETTAIMNIESRAWTNNIQSLGIALSAPTRTAAVVLAVSVYVSLIVSINANYVQSLSNVAAVAVVAVVVVAVPVEAVVVLPVKRVTVTAGPTLGMIKGLDFKATRLTPE